MLLRRRAFVTVIGFGLMVFCCSSCDSGRIRVNDTVGGLHDGAGSSEVAAAPGELRAVACGGFHTCQLSGEGQMYCWGWNVSGQLGVADSTIAKSPSPLPVLDLGVGAIATGFHTTCAVLSTGEIWCWGQNIQGLAGRGGDEHGSVEPNPLQTERLFDTVALGAMHGCALSVEGETWCWGYRYEETSEGAELHVPRLLMEEPRLETIVAGFYHTCGRTNAGMVYCWGEPSNGKTGLAKGEVVGAVNAPKQVPGLPEPAVDLAAEEQASCAVLADGSLWCWGKLPLPGIDSAACPFDGAELTVPTKLQIPKGVTATAVALGFATICFLDSDGEVRCGGCWPYYESGEPPSTADCLLLDRGGLKGVEPEAGWFKIPGLADVQTIASSRYHYCALTEVGDIYCWLSNGAGQLGNGVSSSVARPAVIPGIDAAANLALGLSSTCFFSKDDELICWGAVIDPKVELKSCFIEPSSVGQYSGARSLALGGSWQEGAMQHACLVTASGTIKCWGNNSNGQLGVTGENGAGEPLDVEVELPSAQSVTAGDQHTCSLDAEGGSVTCWGSLGGCFESDSETLNLLILFASDFGWSEIAGVVCGGQHVCAWSDSGKVVCWGNNDELQLGYAGEGSCMPFQEVAVSGVVELVAKDNHTCALTDAGETWCWGDNTDKALSNTEATNLEPEQLATSSATDVCVGSTHVCVLHANGSVQCRGAGSRGQLGHGLHPFSSDFVTVTLHESASFGPAVGLECGHYHTCARDSDGRIACWGDNDSRQLGIGQTGWYATPVKVEFPVAP